jgi:hypothetical protein
MERRKLLQALTALPAMVIAGKDGNPVGVKYETTPDKRYVVFLNARMVDVTDFCAPPSESCPAAHTLPPGTVVHCVYVSKDESMDEIIRIYEVG